MTGREFESLRLHENKAQRKLGFIFFGRYKDISRIARKWFNIRYRESGRNEY